MSTPTLGLTFEDMILRVAEYLGVASYADTTAAIPTDTHDLDMCKRLVNDGYAQFLNEREWTFLSGEATVTPDGTNYIFDLPDDFQGELEGGFTYSTTGPIAGMKEVDEEIIRTLRQGRSVSGEPSLFAIQPKPTIDATTDTARWQVVFWPTPTDTTDTLTAKYRRVPNALSALTDRSIAGPQHDQTVKQAAIRAAEIQRYGQSAAQSDLYTSLLANSVRNDMRHIPRSLGYCGDNSDGGLPIGRWPSLSNEVDEVYGNSVD